MISLNTLGKGKVDGSGTAHPPGSVRTPIYASKSVDHHCEVYVGGNRSSDMTLSSAVVIMFPCVL